jgi:hypothetical protein
MQKLWIAVGVAVLTAFNADLSTVYGVRSSATKWSLRPNAIENGKG